MKVLALNASPRKDHSVSEVLMNKFLEGASQGGARARTYHPARSRNEEQVTVLAAVCGFPDLVNFRQAKGLYPNAVHVFLPASQIISHKEGRKYLEGFMDAVETAGRTLAETGEITDEIKEQLVVDYPEEVKQMIVNQHNEYSASLPTEK